MSYRKSYCLFGYFGFKNFGDDLMLVNALNHLDLIKRNNTYIVFVAEDYYSEQKAFTSFKNIKVKYIRLTPLINYICIYYYAFISREAFWIGGTSLYESSAANLDGIVWLNKVINKFQLFGKNFSFCNIGIGDFTSEKGLNLYKQIVNKSKRFSCRDHVSLMKLKNFFPEKPNVFEGGDLACLLESSFFNRDPKSIVFCGHFQYQDDESVVETYSAILNDICKGKEKVLFMPMHQGTQSDNQFHNKVSQKLTTPFEIINYSDDLFKYMSQAKIVISMRLHGLVLADILGIPNIGISYHDKVSIYIKSTNTLVEYRNKKVKENISIETIQKVISNYKKPTEFLNQEKNKAIKGMKVFEV
ncbi:polysaccharide pyruvyl transferase family protein [Aquimarina sp. I32.4]|uniref:polysaccharide pyruvyl transferase family protein n=1 Tax=Aquimarina sp. I32.4 TaxID=2053903 RepID=UPI000CDF0660|nr:polysaccharide pyruvyl transferase family protein [Aquimarina sp. I32.4]